MGMALAQLIGDDFFNQYGESPEEKGSLEGKIESCVLVRLNWFRVTASKRRQSNRCKIEGWLDYAGQKPARQRAKKTAKPFPHRRLE